MTMRWNSWLTGVVMSIAGTLLVGAPPTMGASASTKPAPSPDAKSAPKPAKATPSTKPAQVSPKALAELRRRAEAAKKAKAAEEAAQEKSAGKPEPKGSNDKVAAAAESDSAAERRNRFLQKREEMRKRIEAARAAAKIREQQKGDAATQPAATPSKVNPSAKPATPKPAVKKPEPKPVPAPPEKPPAEKRLYQFSFHKAEWDEVLNMFCRWSDMTIIGQYPRTPADGITYINPRNLTYYEALHELNILLMENMPSYWLVPEENHLRLRRMSDWHRYIPAEHRFNDLQEFQKAELNDDDWAMVFWVPESYIVGELIADIQATMPDNVLRVASVHETRRLKITGIVFYINQFLKMAQSDIFDPEEQVKDKIRPIKFYKIERAQASSVQQVLERIVLPQRRGRISVTDDADRVDIVLDQMTNTIIVKAKEERHREIAEMIERIEASELVADAKTHFIKLDHARAEDLANLLNPLLQQEARMKPTYDRRKAERERVYLQAEPASNSLIVLATQEGLDRVEKLLKQLDVETPEAQYKRIELKNAKVDQIITVVNTVVQSRYSRRGRRSAPGQQLQVVPDPTGNALFVMGNPKDIEYVEELVAEIDSADVERTKAHIVKLQKARPSVVAQGLQAIFGTQTTGRRGRGPLGSFRVLPDEQSQVLVVICLDSDWKEIEAQIKEFDEQSVSVDPVMRTVQIKHGDAEEIAQTLNQALGGRIGRTRVAIGAERNNNMLFVTTLEPAFEEVKSLIEKLDVPGKEGKLEVIPLANASATDVANLITNMFQARRGRRRFGGDTGPVIIPDQIANALVVRATKTDLEEIELQAARIDDAARGEGHKPQIIKLEYADPQQAANLCEAMFVRRTGRRSAEQRTFFMPMPTGLVVRAPAQQMKEIEDFIKTIDSPESVNIEIKTVQLPGQDVEQVATILQRMFAGETRRGRSASAINFMPDPTSNMLVITAPKKRFEEIDKVIQQYTEGIKVTQSTMKIIELNNARADEVAGLLTEMLGAKLGRGRRRSMAREVQILRDPRQNKLIIFAPDDVMKQAEEMVKQLDVPVGETGGVQWIQLAHADASYVSSTLQQMWSNKQRRSRSSFRDLPAQIWAEPVTNSVLVVASPAEYKEIEQLAKELDEKFKETTTQPTIIKLKFRQPSEIISICQQRFLPRRQSRGRRADDVTESISFVAMPDGVMVWAPPTRMKAIEDFIKQLDDPGESKMVVKRFQLKGMDVSGLYTTLTDVFSKTDLMRDEPRPSFAVDAPHETVTVTCWSSRLPDIEKVVEDFREAEKQKEPSTQKLIDVTYTRASYAASTLDNLLRKQLGDRAARLGSRLSVTYEDRQNRVVVVAPPDVMEQAEKILATIDVKIEGMSDEALAHDIQPVKWIDVENVDASSAASAVNQIWSASQPPQAAQENRPPVRIWPETITNTILVSGAYGKEFELIQEIVKDIDQKSVANPNKPVLIKLEYASPSEVSSMIQALFIPPTRRGQQKVMISTVSGGIIVRAPKIEMKEIQEFIASYDKPEATGLKIRTYHLPNTNVSELSSTLSQIFSYKKRRHNEPGWSFIPNTSADMLMVLAPESRLKEIEDVVKEYQDNVQKAESKMQMFPLQYTRADYVVGVLNSLLREKLRRTRGSRAVNQLQISYESRQNKVVVFAPDDVMKQVEEMIKQIDIELPDQEDRVKWIEIIHADAAEVAQTVEQMFQQQQGRRRRSDSYSIREVRIWPERVTNSILVSADAEDFAEIERLAKKIDDEYALKGLKRVKITPKYVTVSQIRNLIDSLFYARTSRRDVRAQQQRIRIIPAGSYSFFLEAPEDKLEEVKKLIEEMDTEGENAPVIKTYKMGDVDVRQLARTLSQTTGGIGSYTPDPRRGALIVSAPQHQFDRIEKAMEQLKADIEEEEAQFVVLKVKHVAPRSVDGQLRSLVGMQLQQRYRRRDRDMQLSIQADEANNRLFVYGRPDEIELVKKMLEELDQPGLSTEASLHTIPLRYTDSQYMASQIAQVFTPEELQRRAARRGRGTQEVVPIRVVPDPATNSLLITCTDEAFREVELFVAQREDAYREKEKSLELITPKYLSQGQLMATINAIYNPPVSRYGRRQKQETEIRAIPASGSSFYLEAPKDKMPELKELIAQLDVEDKNRPKVRTYKLKDIDVRELTRLLQTTMRDKGTFMADPRMGMVIVSAREFQFPEIEEMMQKLQEDIEETRQQFEILDLKHARPSSVYSTLNQLVSMRMSDRRSRRGQSLQMSIIPDDNNNRLFVYAAKEEMELVKEMLDQLDTPGMVKEAELYTIALERTEATYMATKIQQVFTPEEMKRRRARRNQSVADLIPIRVVPEQTTNTLLITCAEQDFRDIELFVAKIEDAYQGKEKARELITPKFISQGQLMATINAIYNPPRRRGFRQEDVPDIRAIPASGSSFYLEAPKDKMAELLELVKTLDVEDQNQPIVRTYRVKDVDVRQLAQLLQTTMPGKGSFYADTRMDMLIVSAPEFRFEKIEKTMNDLKENLEAVRQQFKVFPLKFAKASNLYSQLSQLVTTRVRGRRSDAQLTILPDQMLNRLFVYAGDEEMKVVEEMLAELDVEGVEPEQQVYSIELKNADCTYAASMVQNMFTQEELARRRRGRTESVIAPIRVMADQMSNRLLIWASPRDYEDIEKFVNEIDERAKDTKPERRIIQPKFVRVNELYSMIQTLFLQQRRKTGQRQRFIETTLVINGADLILNGPKDRLDEIEEFIKTVDTEERSKLVIKTFELPEVNISSLVSTLQQLFSQDPRQQRGTTLFIPDVENSELMISAPQSLMTDIEEIIEQKKEGASKRSRKLTMVEIEHTDANYLASMLQPLIVERSRSKRGRYAKPEVTITPEPRMNRLLIMAAEAETQIAMDLIKELDTEAMALKGQVRTIQLDKAEASYVASTLQTMFSRRSQMRRSYRSSETPVYVVAEEMTNRLFVAASEADFKEIEKLAKEMDAAAELEGVQEEKIEVKYASPSQLVSVIQQMFEPMRQRSRRRAESDVRLSVIGQNIIAQAPAKKMVEIKKWIQELDVEEFAETETRFFQLEIARARDVQTIITPLLNVKAQELDLKQGQKKRRGPDMVVTPDVRNNRLIITAQTQILKLAEELIKDLDVEDPVWSGETVEIISLKQADATEVSRVLTQILKDEQGTSPNRPKKGGRAFTGLAVMIVPDAASNTLLLKGLPEELDRVRKLVEEIDGNVAEESVVFKRYVLESSDAEEVATLIQEMAASLTGARRRGSAMQVSSDYMMNAVYVAAAPKHQRIVEQVIKTFEEPEMVLDPETNEMVEKTMEPFQFIELKYSNAQDIVWDLETLITNHFGEKKAPTVETFWDDPTTLMVSGKPDQVKIVEKFVQMFEDKNKLKPPVTRTLDLGELQAKDLAQRLVDYGLVSDPEKVDLKDKHKGVLVPEITLEDAQQMREKADREGEMPKKTRERPKLRRLYERTKKPVRFGVPGIVAELSAELEAVACAAAAKSDDKAEAKPTTLPKRSMTIRPNRAVREKAKATDDKADSKAKPAQSAAAKNDKPAGKAAAAKDAKKAAPKKAAPKASAPKKDAAKKPPAKKAEPSASEAKQSAPRKANAKATADKADPKTESAKTAASAQDKTSPAAAKASGSAASATKRSSASSDQEDGEAESPMAGRAREGEAPDDELKIMIDAERGMIRVTGPERKVTEIEDLIWTLQDEMAAPYGKEMEFKVYKPRHLDVNVASAMLDRIFNEPKKITVPTPKQKKPAPKKGDEKEDELERMMGMGMGMREMMRERGAGVGKTQIRLVPDPRTGFLIVGAPSEMHRDIQRMLGILDVPPDLAGDVAYFKLVNLNVTEVEAGLKAVLKLDRKTAPKMPKLPKNQNQAIQMLQAQIKQLSAGASGASFTAEEVTLHSDTTTNTLIVMAPEEVMEIVEDYIITLENEAGNIEIVSVALEAADASTVAKSITELYSTGGVQVGGKTVGAGSSQLTIVPDTGTNTVFVRASKDLSEEVVERIKKLDAEFAKEGKPFRIPLTKADAEVLAPKLEDMFQTRKTKRGRQVQIVGHNPSNTLIVTAPDVLRPQIEEMVEALDVETVDIDFRVFPLEHASAVEIHEQLTQMTMQVLGQLRGKGTRGMKMDVFAAVPDPRTNSLIVTGGEATFAIVEKLKAELDVEPKGISEQVTVVYPLEQADASRVAQTITQLYKSGRRSSYLKKSGMPPPTAEYEATTNTLIVRATEKLQKMIKKDVIDKLEEYSVRKKIKDTTIQLEHAKADEVAETLNQYFSQRQRSARRGRINPTEMVSIVPEPDSNALLVTCNDENLETINELLERMDREDVAGKSARKMKVIQLEFADPRSVSSAISQAFGGRGRGRQALRDRVDAVPEYTTSSVVVVASDENMQQIDTMIAELDVESAGQRVTKQIALEHAQADEVAQQLTTLFIRTRRRTHAGVLPVTVTSDTRTNSVIVAAKPTDMEEVEKLIQSLDVPADLLKQRQMKIFQLEWAEPSTMASMIQQAFRTTGSRRNPMREVMATYEYSTGSLIVAAPPDQMKYIEKLVEDVDTESTTAKQMHVVEVRNAEPADLVTALNQMFVYGRRTRRGGQPPITIVNPTGTNKIMVMANESDFKKVAQAVEQMDVGAGDMAVRTIRLVNIAPEEAETILQEFLRKPGRSGRYDPSLLGNVRVTVSPSAGTLIVTARKERLDELETLIKKIDAEAAEEGAGARKIEIFRMDFANPYYTATAITNTFRKRGRVSESDLVTATAEMSTSAVIVSASERNLVKIRKFIEELDVEDAGRRVTETVKLKHAQADEVASQLTSIFRQTRRTTARGQMPVTVEPDTRSNSVIIAARPTEIKEVKDLIALIDVEEDEMLGRRLKPFTLRYADPSSMASIINSSFRRRYGRESPSDVVQATAEYGTNSVVVSATPENLEKVEAFIQEMDKEGSGTRKTYLVEVVNAEAEDVAEAVEDVFLRTRGRRSANAPTVTNPEGTNQIVVRASAEDFKEIETLVKQLDEASGAGAGEEVRLVRLMHVPPEEAEEILQEFLRKSGRRSRYGGGELRGNVRITASESAGGLIIAARKEKLDELEQLIKKFDVDEPEDSPGVRRIEIFPLEFAHPYYVAQSITQSFRSSGRSRTESDMVTATAELSTNSLIVMANKKNMDKIREFIKKLDTDEHRGMEVKVTKLTKARAEDVAETLTDIYRSRRRGSRDDQAATITAEEGSNAIIVSARKADHDEIDALIAQLDVDPTADDVIEVIPLEFIDAEEAEEMMESYLQRSGRGRRSGDLVGGTRLSSLTSMNAVVISGRKENVTKLKEVVAGLDTQDAAADLAPRIIQLKSAPASLMASTLDQLFTEPAREAARGRRGRGAQMMIPLIIPDETTQTLIVRARKSDYNRIEEMAKQLDRPDLGGAIKIVTVPASMDVVDLASQVEEIINQGERYRSQQTGKRASMIVVGYDLRTNSLIVSGAPEQFGQVEQVVKQLQEIKPPGGQVTRMIQLKNLQADDVSRALEEMMERQGGRRRYRRR